MNFLKRILEKAGWASFSSKPEKPATAEQPVKKKRTSRLKVWRQGDVFIISTPEIPAEAAPDRPVLALGEVTGHSHQLADGAPAGVMRYRGQLFLSVTGDDAAVVHEEHGPITVPRGSYEIRIQREYHPKEIRKVID